MGELNIPDLIGLAVVFLILALVAYILGARGIAGFSMEIAKWLVIIFIILIYNLVILLSDKLFL